MAGGGVLIGRSTKEDARPKFDLELSVLLMDRSAAASPTNSRLVGHFEGGLGGVMRAAEECVFHVLDPHVVCF